MTVLVHTKPCKACPWRRESAAGWLGSSTPEEFVGAALHGAHMPCHEAVDYDADDWRKRLVDAPHCAGSLIFLRNVGALPRDPVLAGRRAQVEPDRETVFDRPDHFVEHHRSDA